MRPAIETTRFRAILRARPHGANKPPQFREFRARLGETELRARQRKLASAGRCGQGQARPPSLIKQPHRHHGHVALPATSSNSDRPIAFVAERSRRRQRPSPSRCQRRRHQQHLTAVTRNEISSHPGSLLNPADRPIFRQPLAVAIVSIDSARGLKRLRAPPHPPTPCRRPLRLWFENGSESDGSTGRLLPTVGADDRPPCQPASAATSAGLGSAMHVGSQLSALHAERERSLRVARHAQRRARQVIDRVLARRGSDRCDANVRCCPFCADHRASAS